MSGDFSSLLCVYGSGPGMGIGSGGWSPGTCLDVVSGLQCKIPPCRVLLDVMCCSGGMV